jgi:N-methylhydantoinase A
MDLVVGVDIGGTFTDTVAVSDAGKVSLGKAFSTSPDPVAGIVDSLALAAEGLGLGLTDLLKSTRLLLHSSTTADNAVLTGNLARTGLITTRGFETTLFATRGGYGRWSGLSEEEKRDPIATDKLPPLVPLSLTASIHERTDRAGQILVAPTEAEIESQVRLLLDRGVEALGVCLLWSFTNPESERKVREVVSRVAPDLFVSLSHELAPMIGEYERTSTVALNCALSPVVSDYLLQLERRLSEREFGGVLLVMQAYGGLVSAAEAVAKPVSLIESGPVSGLVGTKELGESLGFTNVIAADMGGTTFKVGVVRDGLIEYQREPMVLRYHYALPKLDVVSLGLAGGTILWMEPRTGTPRLGPRSAGSFPGPVCYGHGGDEPTLTDVDAVLGYLHPEFFAGGRLRLDVERATEVFDRLIAQPLDLSAQDAAAAMFRLANSITYDLVHKMTVQRGLDPRQFALFAYGGTAGMHVMAYAEELGVRAVVIPHSASVHGAFGLVTSDVVHELQVTRPARLPVDPGLVEEVFQDMSGEVLERLRLEGFEGPRVRIERSIDMRYGRQVHILTAPVVTQGRMSASALDEIVARFEALYREKYGSESAFREAGIEMVTFRVRAVGFLQRPKLAEEEAASSDAAPPVEEMRRAWVDNVGEFRDVPGYRFDLLRPGNRLVGPAILWSPITTIVLHDGQRASVDGHKNLLISLTGDPLEVDRS